MVFILKARHGVVRLRFQPGRSDTARLQRLEQRQPPAMQQVMDQRRDEHGLAGARQAGHAEPQRRIDEIGGAVRNIVEGNQRFVCK
ncbi:hypothetical protein D3C87_1718740 [compost metagenome]